MLLRKKLSFPTAMTIGELMVVNGRSIHVCIMNDNEIKVRDPVKYSSIKSGRKPTLSDCRCK